MNVYTSLHSVQEVLIQTRKTVDDFTYTVITVHTSDLLSFELTLHQERGELKVDITNLETRSIIDRKKS